MSSNTLLQGSTSLRWPNDSSSPRQFSKEESHMSHMYRKSQHTEGRCGASKSDHLEHERCPTLPFMALPGKKRCENSKWLVGGGGQWGTSHPTRTLRGPHLPNPSLSCDAAPGSLGSPLEASGVTVWNQSSLACSASTPWEEHSGRVHL